MPTISLCMIVRGEEQTLDRVAGVADEIILVDTDSAGQTRETAAQYICKLYSFT